MKEESQTVLVAEPPEVEAVAAPLRALLIEDNPGDARLIHVMLAEAGSGQFQLERTDRLASGLARLANGGIGLVLLDLSLPDSRGLDTFLKVHAQAPHTPIIVLSGLNDELMAVKAVHEGAQDYLVKGQVDGQLLVRAMRYALERQQTADQLARYAEELRAKNAALEADFHMAREIQEVFLPSAYPRFPQAAASEQSALRFYHRYLPAAAVGGDFFNVFALTDTTAGVFICDVTGHGIRAALVTAILRGLVEELRPAAADPGQFLTEINRSLHAILSHTEQPMLATAFYLILDVAAPVMRFASAGHPSPFRLCRGVETVEPIKHYDASHGPVLGLFVDTSYPTGHCPVSAGDSLLLFTDGLYEVNGPAQEEFGLDRLLAAVRRRLRLPLAQLCDELLEEVEDFAADSGFDDDVCLVGIDVARIGPAALSGGQP
jgi:sigma-B regulation protein RsbU (phosphoserine phosphatase)